MYYKGANLIHTIRQVINDDERFRSILRGLNKTFYHQTVSTQQVEQYISTHSGVDFSKVFDQYLRTTQIPVLEIVGDNYRWSNVVKGFSMPVKLTDGNWLLPTTEWQKEKISATATADPNFYIQVKRN